MVGAGVFDCRPRELPPSTIIGTPAIAYSGNMTFLQLVFGYIVGRIDHYHFVARIFSRGVSDGLCRDREALRQPHALCCWGDVSGHHGHWRRACACPRLRWW